MDLLLNTSSLNKPLNSKLMDFNRIINDIKNKVFYPIYFLTGEEPYYIDEISDEIEKGVLADMEKEFNQSVLYGKDINPSTIIDYAKRFPMMANHQVIIVKEAQDIDKIDELLPYVENPMGSTILVICYKHKKFDGRTKFAKTLNKSNKAVFFNAKKLYDNKIPEWITNYLRKHNYTISQNACALLADYLGTDLSKISNELGKLIINVPPKTEINVDHIERYIGISKDFNVFELQKALGIRNVLKANQIINHFGANLKENPLVKVNIILYQYFSKILIYHGLKDKSQNNAASALSISPFFVRDFQTAAGNYSPSRIKMIIGLLREYDMKAKGVDNVSINDGELMKELIFKILH